MMGFFSCSPCCSCNCEIMCDGAPPPTTATIVFPAKAYCYQGFNFAYGLTPQTIVVDRITEAGTGVTQFDIVDTETDFFSYPETTACQYFYKSEVFEFYDNTTIPGDVMAGRIQYMARLYVSYRCDGLPTTISLSVYVKQLNDGTYPPYPYQPSNNFYRPFSDGAVFFTSYNPCEAGSTTGELYSVVPQLNNVIFTGMCYSSVSPVEVSFP